MLTGHINPEKEAVVKVQVIGPAGQAALVEAAIDTGYDGFLTLPALLINDLDLSSEGTVRATLGNGTTVSMDVFLATVAWEEELRKVVVLAAEGGALLGMAMLAGSRVILDVEDEGAVTIESLARIRSVH